MMKWELATRFGLRGVMFGAVLYGGMHALLGAQPKGEKADEPVPGKPAPEAVSPDAKSGVLGMLFGADADKRLVIVEVAPNSVAADVGVQKKDVLVSFDGHKVAEKDELIKLATKTLSAKKPGEEIEIVVQRSGRLRTLVLIAPPDNTAPSTAAAVTKLVDKNTVFCMALRETEGGRVVVQKVLENSPPHQAGILPKDIIVTFGEAKINSVDQLRDAVRLTQLGAEVTVGIVRDKELLTTQVVIAACTTDVAAPLHVAANPESLERLAARLKILQAQIEELRVTAEGIAATVEAMRNP